MRVHIMGCFPASFTTSAEFLSRRALVYHWWERGQTRMLIR